MEEKNVLVIGGPTGSGESTITREIIKRFPVFTRLVTATTRAMRGGEKDLVDYYFFSKERFKEEIANGNIIEYTHIKNRDDYYGSYKPDLDKKIFQKMNVVVNPDIVGARFYKNNYGATTIFISPGKLENLRGRIKKRNPEISQEELEKRLENARLEMENEMSFYDYIVINEENKLEQAVDEVINILKKENYKLS